MSSVSHELRTPLTSIRALSEMLNDDPEMAGTDRQRFLSIIASESERLTRLVNQILDMAKIESGRAEWQVEPVDLGERHLMGALGIKGEQQRPGEGVGRAQQRFPHLHRPGRPEPARPGQGRR